jgi:hypothetical protein
METIVAAVTVRPVDPATPSRLAIICADPVLSPVARPLTPELLPTEATVVAEEVQVTEVVRSRVELSEYTPVALNVVDVPLAMLKFAGVTPMETKVAAVTVSVVDPDIFPSVAVIVVDPVLSAVARPWLPVALLIEATVGLLELHTTCAEMASLVPSLNRPIAVNNAVEPIARLPSGGPTAMPVS